ncbi:DUF2948 family protein [Meridianimarinicoccus sp. RP-17]|uniref:DUF2948 family protein n=1 Tax=Meridianimarinicoccus zhengii TaxID=2056810 RepID=UPI000DAB9778|nr:DUF2948 family protein [Phycocomes zhengii]
MTDARFEDGDESPLRLVAQAPDDVPVISALVQDAVFPATEMRFDAKRRQFALLVNRFRWEDRGRAERQGRPYERVQSMLVVNDALSVASSGIDRGDAEMVLSLLSLDFAPGADGVGTLTMTLAGDGAIRVDVECLDLVLRDVTRPYVAPSGKAPAHRD